MFDIHFTFFIRILRSYKTDGATFCIFHYVFFLSFIKISSEPELIKNFFFCKVGLMKKNVEFILFIFDINLN